MTSKRKSQISTSTFREIEHVEEAIAEADVIYMEPVVQPDYTKSRDERTGDVGRTPANYKVTKELMRKAKQSSIILHSLPRMDELPEEVDYTRHARYWIEAFNGVVVRMSCWPSFSVQWNRRL
jgi:aspartate carbamoyltransferase catalytic subunit